MEELCRVAQVPVDEVAFLSAPGSSAASLERYLEYWRQGVDWSTQGQTPEPIWRLSDWLAKQLPEDRPAGFAWGDARVGNMMFGDDFRVVGVMDWEAATLGGIRQDLAWWLFFDQWNGPARGLPVLDGFGTREETIAFWEERVGEEAGDLTWYEVFTAFQITLLSIRGQLTMGVPNALDLESNAAFQFARERLGW